MAPVCLSISGSEKAAMSMQRSFASRSPEFNGWKAMLHIIPRTFDPPIRKF
jgi:hypothetical protein